MGWNEVLYLGKIGSRRFGLFVKRSHCSLVEATTKTHTLDLRAIRYHRSTLFPIKAPTVATIAIAIGYHNKTNRGLSSSQFAA